MAQRPPLPPQYSYSAEHEWVNATADAVVGATLKVGITAIASDALGEVVYADIPEVGDSVTAGEICGEVESTKTVSDLFSPVTGEVTAVNELVSANPGILNSDPYGEGWLVEIAPDDPAEVGTLLDAEGYRASLG